MTDLVLYIIIAVTGLISWYTWQNTALFYKYQFNAYMIVHKKQYIRLFSHAFLHGGWAHLIINMLVLYSFGRNILYIFSVHPSFSKMPVVHFLILYFGAVVVSSLYSLAKYKDNPHYNAVGASGAVSAVVFTSIFFMPWSLLYFFGILPIPAILFGVGYLIYSYRAGKKGNDNIGHDAHFWGAVFGFAYPMMVDFTLISNFIERLVAINF